MQDNLLLHTYLEDQYTHSKDTLAFYDKKSKAPVRLYRERYFQDGSRTSLNMPTTGGCLAGDERLISSHKTHKYFANILQLLQSPTGRICH